MIALLRFLVTLFASPFKSKSRLEAENAALRAATRRLRAMGIRDKPIAPGSPWQNGFAERLIGSIRRECVDHIVVLGETHLRRVLKSYDRYL
jgi:transposase InsO family protein